MIAAFLEALARALLEQLAERVRAEHRRRVVGNVRLVHAHLKPIQTVTPHPLPARRAPGREATCARRGPR